MRVKKIPNQTPFVLFTAIFILAASAFVAQAQNYPKFKVGDRVDCDGSKGTVVEFSENDMFNGYKPDSGYYYRVKIDGLNTSPWFCKAEKMRSITKTTANQTTDNNQADNKTANPYNDNQDQPSGNGKFKTGDRVECDSSELHKNYMKGTIVPFKDGEMFNGNPAESGYFYRILFDDSLSRSIHPDGLPCRAEDMRLLTGNDKKNDSPQMSDVPAERKPIKCPEQPEAKGGAIPLALAKQLIRCRWEEGSDNVYTINFDLHSAQIGTPRLWNANNDIGTGVHGKTLVYPVKGTWTMRTYSSSGVAIVEKEGIHNCYIDAFNKWQCGLFTSKDLKPLQSISKQ